MERTGFPAYLDQDGENAPTYGLIYLAAMLSINLGIAHPSGVLDMVIASTHDEHQFLRVRKADNGEDFVITRDDRDDQTLGQIYKMPVISTRHIHQDVFSSKFSVRRIIGGKVALSTGSLKGHRLKLYRSSGITSGPHLLRLAKKREERRQVTNLFAPLPLGQNTAANAARITQIAVSRPLTLRVPLSQVPVEKLGGHLRPIPVMRGVYVLCAPTSQEAADPSFPQFALRRHIVRWLFSNPAGVFECCVGLFAGTAYYSIQVNVVVLGRSVIGCKLYYLRHTNVTSDLRPVTSLSYPSLTVQEHHFGAHQWWTVVGQRFQVAVDLSELLSQAEVRLKAAIGEFARDRKFGDDDPIVWTARNTRALGTLPYRELDRYEMKRCDLTPMPVGVESQAYHAQLESQREDLVGSVLGP